MASLIFELIMANHSARERKKENLEFNNFIWIQKVMWLKTFSNVLKKSLENLINNSKVI